MQRIAAMLVVLSLALPAGASEVLKLSDLAGEWIDAAYADALAKTRSPLDAAKTAIPTAFSLHQEKGVWRLKATDFHEGYWRIAVKLVPANAGAYDLVVGAAESSDLTKTERIRIATEASGNALVVRGPIFSTEEPGRYRRIDTTAERWANRLLLAGRYADGHGRPFAFSADGVASFPGQPDFHYDIVLDTSESCCDYVNTMRKPRNQSEDRIAYRWNGSALELFDVITDPEAECPIRRAETPFATLMRK